MEFVYRVIGFVRSPHVRAEGAPIQPAGARGVAGRIELLPEFAPGLADLEGFSHLFVLYHFHHSRGFDLSVTPFLDGDPHGVFATRAPRRPNPIGLSVLRLDRIEGHVIHLLDVDILDGTPVLDVKPYVPAFDTPEGESRAGWLQTTGQGARHARADARFVSDG